MNFLDKNGFIKHTEYATSCFGMATIYLSLDLIDSAEIYVGKALSITKNAHGERHPDYLMLLRRLAGIHSSLRKFNNAIEYNKQALEILKGKPDTKQEVFADIYNEIAVNYRKKGFFLDAEKYYYAAIAIYKELNIKGKMATLDNNLGYLNVYMNKFEKADSLINCALELRKEVDKNDSTKFWFIVHSLAKLTQERGNHLKADSIYDKYWSIVKKIEIKTKCDGLLDMCENAISLPGNKSLKILKIVDSLNASKQNIIYAKSLRLRSQISVNAKEFKKADSLLVCAEKTINQIKKNNSNDGIEVDLEYGEIMLGFSSYYISGKTNYEKAIFFADSAARLFKELFGEEHHLYVKAIQRLARIYTMTCDYERSLALNRQALNILSKTIGEECPMYATGLNNIGVTLGNIGEDDKKLEYYIRANNIIIKNYPKGHLNKVTGYNNIGNTYMDLGKYDMALEYFEKAEKVLNIISNPKDKNNFSPTYQNYATFYNLIGDRKKEENYLRLA
ncbi:MAG: tetratricopeptide repeat protein, partial [Bacteroidota bacterium]